MLPLFHRQIYGTWLDYLQVLQQQVQQGDLLTQEAFDLVQKYFQETVLSLSEEGIDLAIVGQWRSRQTELHRLVRLLATDWLLCRSSRQSSTIAPRLNRLQNHLQTIQEYCQILST